MENKQTAVDWLYNMLHNEEVILYHGLFELWYKQAKAMEKEQIKEAWLSGQDDGATICTPNQHYPDEDYYNETYKQQDNNE